MCRGHVGLNTTGSIASMKKTIIVLAVSTVLLPLSVIVTGNIISAARFRSEVSELFSSSKNISGTMYTHDRLKGLPAPVQNYFRHVLKEGRPYVSYARLRHGGEFKTGRDKDWVRIEGEEYFTVQNPGFIWRGKIPFASARDMYINNRGRLVVLLFSAIPIIDGKGPNFDQGELLRWLTESVLFPTALLPGENLRWSPIDSGSARLVFTHGGMRLSCTVSFNDRHEITQLKTRRYMDHAMENWTGKCGEYKEVDGMKVPTRIEAVWNLSSGDFSYARFTMREIEFDRPEQY